MSQIRRSLLGFVPAVSAASIPTNPSLVDVVENGEEEAQPVDVGALTRTSQKPVFNKNGEEIGVVTTEHRIRDGEQFVVRLLVSTKDFVFKEAQGEKPAHFHARIMGVDIHLRDGLKPEDLKENNVSVEVKTRKVKSTTGPDTFFYKYVNVFPADAAGPILGVLSVGKILASGREIQRWRGKAPGIIFLAAP